ncbi:ATP-grasp peptide maturase system methyltransferase [Streptomyces sp. NPDC049597]|uniref:ATP-grasp peptide maturase system methyltransferase n=1 Tax=Streptomyces sp. NPDC049597 TaxID=3155276 RepID=UPI003433D682
MSDDKILRERLADELTGNGSLRSPQWRQAVLDVPRHEFLRGGYFRQVDGPGPTGWEPVMPDAPAWLPACYSNESLVTQIAGTIVPGDIQGRIFRQPTSSSTLPGLVVRILEEAHIEDGNKLALIGAGTGASTALACHRLGDDLVTAVEYDQDVAQRARTSLAACGMSPDLVTADGLLGYEPNAPYDRLVATVGVLNIPRAWIEQVRPGGLIVATVCGWMYSSELVRLTVHDDGTATGQFLGGQVSFMLARPHLPPPLGMLPDLDDGEECEATVGPDALDDWTARFVAQTAAPRTQRFQMERAEGGTQHVFLDVDSGAWAALHREGNRWLVRQGGTAGLWHRIEDHVTRWQRDGQPDLERFTITITPEGQSITW